MQHEETIFAQALAKASPQERDAFLQQACGENLPLRERVEALLKAHARGHGVLDGPLPGLTDPSPTAHLDLPVTESPGSVIGRYKLLEQIGEGGFGVVFMAEQQAPIRRRVALKVLKAGMDTRQVIARFQAERQALAMMDHPNIARVIDAGETDTGRPYFVMELVHGIAITDYCDREQLTPRQRLELFVPVCQAVQHAHQKGIIHRDLKPSNVLVTLQDGGPVSKVIDFGIAKAVQGEQLGDRTLFTGFAQMMGTPLYMSPEQAELSGTDVDTRSDVYALGVLLYELLTGTTPLDKERLKQAAHDEIRRILREEDPPTPSTRLSGMGERLATVSAQRKLEPKTLGRFVRGELDWIVMRALDKQRDRRYGSAGALAEDVQRYLRGDAVEASPPSRFYRMRKTVRRYRRSLATAAVLAVVLIAATAISTWQATRATRAERRAAAEAERARTDAAIARAVNEFLNEDLLAQADPANQPDRELKLRTVLDRAAERIEGRFVDQPLVEAAIRRTIGKTYHSIGEHEKAARQLQRALELNRLHRGDEHSGTLEVMEALAAAHKQAPFLAADTDPNRSWDKAIDLYRQVTAVRSRLLGDEHPLTLRSRFNVYDVNREGDPSELEALARRVLQDQRETLPADDPDVLTTVRILGRLCSDQRRFDDAEGYWRQAVQGYRRRLGERHPLALVSAFYWNLALRKCRRLEEAIVVAERLYALEREVRGGDHYLVRETEKLLAGCCQQQARLLCLPADGTPASYARGMELARRAAALRPADPNGALGMAHYRLGDYGTAITTLQQAFNKGHGGEAYALMLAMAHHRTGRRAEAGAWFAMAIHGGQPPEQQLRVEAANVLDLPDVPTPATWRPSEDELAALLSIANRLDDPAQPFRLIVTARLRGVQHDQAVADTLLALKVGQRSTGVRSVFAVVAASDEVWPRVAEHRPDHAEFWLERAVVVSARVRGADPGSAEHHRNLRELRQCYQGVLHLVEQRRAAGTNIADEITSLDMPPDAMVAMLSYRSTLIDELLAGRVIGCEAVTGGPFPVPGTIEAKGFNWVSYSKREGRAVPVQIHAVPGEGAGSWVSGPLAERNVGYSLRVTQAALYDVEMRLRVTGGADQATLRFFGSGRSFANSTFHIVCDGQWRTYRGTSVELAEGLGRVLVVFGDSEGQGEDQSRLNGHTFSLDWIRVSPAHRPAIAPAGPR